MLNTSKHLSLQKKETLQIHNYIEFVDDLSLREM